jgi:hypothetical protein
MGEYIQHSPQHSAQDEVCTPAHVTTACCLGDHCSALNVLPARFIAHIAANQPWCKTSKATPDDQWPRALDSLGQLRPSKPIAQEVVETIAANNRMCWLPSPPDDAR